jgi:cytokinin dehydrogenase
MLTDQQPAQFDAIRAGLGQVAVVTRATLRLVPAPRQVRRFLLSYPDLATILGDQRLLASERRFEGIQGAVLAAPTGGWMFRLDLVKDLSGDPPDETALLAGLSDDRARAEPTNLPYLDYLDRLAALERLLRSGGWWPFPHPWLTTFVGDAAVEAVAAGELAKLTPADLGPLGQVVISPILRESVRTPMLRLPPDPVCYTFNLVRLPATDDAVGAGRLVTANRAIYERVRDAGGTLYPVSAFPMSAADWRTHFEATFDGSPRSSASTTRATYSRPATRSSSRRWRSRAGAPRSRRRRPPDCRPLSGRAVQLYLGSWHGSPAPRPP